MSHSDIPEYYENGRDHTPGIEHLATQINEQTTQIKEQTNAIKEQTHAINGQTTGIMQFMELYQKAVPLRIVFLIFGMIFGLFFGIETVKFFFNFLTKYFLI
jgi:hypothetical protein